MDIHFAKAPEEEQNREGLRWLISTGLTDIQLTEQKLGCSKLPRVLSL